ncbi:MAG: DUF6094 domain-containing protein [Clostridium celatum]|uniref:DUF6094 domain-containing protein n=1 Tax=Clostridium tertium TaxID=1559 RepID=UPI0029026A71|nr:DUF6094 domain-containing protein [Clostridium celatum]
MEVKSRLLSSDRQFGNQGVFGFVPTSEEIVKKELDLIDFSEIEGNDFPVNVCDLSGGKGDQLHWMNTYLKSREISSNCYYNEISEERYNQCLRSYPYMNSLNCDFFYLKVGHKENKNFNKKVFSIIRNNPPYMYLEKRGDNVRAELEFFLKNTLLDIDGGIHIMEVPIHQLVGIKNFINMICYRYEVFIAKFPKGVFEKFKQVAIICKKKSMPSNNKEEVEKIYYQIDNDCLPFLDEVNEKVIKVSRDDFRKAKNINIFRENKITLETLSNGLNEVLDTLIISDKKANKTLKGVDKLKPLIELQAGHISQLLTSGKYDSIMGNLLIRGGANKVIEVKVIEEDWGKETTIETEVLKPFVEITNKNGDILYKDF